MLEKLGKFLQGKKTYIIAIVVGLVAVLKHYGIEVPELVWTILAALGLGAIRSAVSKIVK